MGSMEFLKFVLAYTTILVLLQPACQQQEDSLLAAECTNDNNCTVNAYCHPLRKCYCKKGFVPFRKPGKRKYPKICLKEASFIGDYCETDIQCKTSFGTHAECYLPEPGNKVGQCQCIKDSHYKDGLCYKTALIGGICEVNDNCLIKSPNLLAVCDRGYCICPPNYHSTADGTDCQLRSELGGPCIDDTGCAVLNSECRYGICACKRKYITNDVKSYCLELAEKMDDPCEEHFQCNTFLSNTRCDKEKGVCVCENDAHYIDGSCWKSSKLLEPCEYNAECLINKLSQHSIVCRSGICQCNDGYALEEQSYCMKVNTTLSSSVQQISPHILIYGTSFFLIIFKQSLFLI